MSDLRILFCAPEVVPYAKTGGLADVAGSLPRSLVHFGCDVRIFMPLYRSAREKIDNLAPLKEPPPISVGLHDYRIFLWESRTPEGIPIYFLEKDELYDRSHLYGSPARGDYQDNAERYITFCQAVRTLCLQLGWFPDIFHLHDWQTALVAAYSHFYWRYEPAFTRSGTVFTIHNLAYHGLFPAGLFQLTRLPREAFSLDGIEFWGQCNFLKAGLVYSDFLTTVSPGYSREILKKEHGCGLEGVLQDRREELTGILNGVDYSAWSPEADEWIPARYDALHLSGKQACKQALLTELGLPAECSASPLLGMIGRMATQKGADLLIEIMEDLMSLPVSLVILGTGDAAIEEKLREAAALHPLRIKVLFKFDEGLAHRIEAGADIFLMPSHYEPCGLNQLYSLRYGTIPVVHATGGLDDSVVDVLQNPHTGTGFKFYEYKPLPFLYVTRSAIELYQNKEKWIELQGRAMAQDFSWDRSAADYMEVYEKVMDRRKKVL